MSLSLSLTFRFILASHLHNTVDSFYISNSNIKYIKNCKHAKITHRLRCLNIDVAVEILGSGIIYMYQKSRRGEQSKGKG
jgi:hypothetical protein